jgi:hypothetical protein
MFSNQKSFTPKQYIGNMYSSFRAFFIAYFYTTDGKAADSWSKVFPDFTLLLVLCEHLRYVSAAPKDWILGTFSDTVSAVCMYNIYWRNNPPPKPHNGKEIHSLAYNIANFIIKRFSVFVTNRQNRSLRGPLSARLANTSICIDK